MKPPVPNLNDLELQLASPADTLAAGRTLGTLLQGGELIALSGPLGAGKTLFVKGLALGLDVPADEPIVSPTFVLVREYAGRLKLYHLDAYRLNNAEDLLAIGWEELRADMRAVVALEWADRVPELLAPDAWRIELAYDDAGGRRLRLAPPDAAAGARWAAQWKKNRPAS